MSNVCPLLCNTLQEALPLPDPDSVTASYSTWMEQGACDSDWLVPRHWLRWRQREAVPAAAAASVPPVIVASSPRPAADTKVCYYFLDKRKE